MARKARHPPLAVFLNGRLVGELRREPGGAVEFRYASDWLGWEGALPVSLSLPLRETPWRGAPVVAVFDNLLPDGEPLRRSLAARVRAEGTDAYSMLAAIGRDCVGALQFLPEGETPGEPGAVAGTPVSDRAIAAILENLGRAPLGLDAEDAGFRISLAGAQEKTALLRHRGRWYRPTATTATTHIVKPQIGILPNGIDLTRSVENEFLCLRLASAFGLATAEAAIADFAGVRALVVTRFDRHWTRDRRLLRLPQEDMCQALSVPPALKYEADGGPGMGAILELLRGSDRPEEDCRRFLRAAMGFWLLGATDGHAKNFSVSLYPGGRFRLAPLYDIVSAEPGLAAGQVRRNRMKLAMAVGRTRHTRIATVMPRHFVETAKAAGVGAAVAEEELAALRDLAPAAVERVLAELPADFPAEVAEPIAAGVRARAAALGAAISA